jgi:hypothetical protein
MSVKKKNQGQNASSATADAEQTQGEDGKATRNLTTGVIVGRAAERLLKLENDERDALANTPATIKAAYAKKKDEVLASLTEAQRKGALAMVEAMRPVVDEAAAE